MTMETADYEHQEARRRRQRDYRRLRIASDSRKRQIDRGLNYPAASDSPDSGVIQTAHCLWLSRYTDWITQCYRLLRKQLLHAEQKRMEDMAGSRLSSWWSSLINGSVHDSA